MGLLPGADSRQELEVAGAFRVYHGPAAIRLRLDDLGIRREVPLHRLDGPTRMRYPRTRTVEHGLPPTPFAVIVCQRSHD